MQNTANIEQIILDNLRQLPLEKQQEVLDFTEFLRQKLASKITTSQPSLRQIASMSLAERHQLPHPVHSSNRRGLSNKPRTDRIFCIRY